MNEALARTNAPAIALIVVAAIGGLFQILGLLLNILGTGFATGMGGNEALGNLMSGSIGIGLGLLGLAMTVVVILGALKMKNGESYGFALAASIIAMVPCISPCCVLGLPVGIWALVVLLNADVKAAFAG